MRKLRGYVTTAKNCDTPPESSVHFKRENEPTPNDLRSGQFGQGRGTKEKPQTNPYANFEHQTWPPILNTVYRNKNTSQARLDPYFCCDILFLEMKNNYAFIDSQNLNLGIREQGWSLDFAKFSRYIKDRFAVSQIFLFIGLIPENQSLYTYLQKQGYILIFKPTLKLPNEKVKGNVDAELVLHAMIEYPNYDKAIIITGDGDFHCLVEYLEKNNKLEKLVIPNKYKYSSLFRRFSRLIVFLNNTREKLGRGVK